MAFNKFMHPRNRYKDNKPNFDELARKYPEFSRHVVRNQSGNATLDFRDAEALRALTCTLLREDFGLRVELPLDRLIPTLSLRLNYIHWIEDLLASSKQQSQDGGTTWGMDVGCGPSCIYPLLGSQMNGWHFLASEVDGLAIHYARENLARNGLQDKITVIESEEGNMFQHVLDSATAGGHIRQQSIHFTMCNPPFFGSALDAQGIMGSRSMARPEPKTVSTAAELEMIAEGGEVAFVHRMIEESLVLRKQVMWYTSMLGKKSSLAAIKEELKRHKINNVTHTEFCQGRTMRWGVAWTFFDDVEPLLPASKRRKLQERCPPFILPVTEAFIKRSVMAGQSGGLQNKIQAVAKAIHVMMEDLQMTVERKPTSKWCAKFELTARRDTWSHQRRKRRREKLHQEEANPSGISPKKSSATPTLGTCTSSQGTDPANLESMSSQLQSMDKDTCNKGQTAGTVPTCEDFNYKDEIARTSDNKDLPSGQRASTTLDSNEQTVGTSAIGSDHPCGQKLSTSIDNNEEPLSTSSDEMDDRFPLEIRLDVKLGEKRAIVVEAAASNATQRSVLHQVVQYVKNQMK